MGTATTSVSGADQQLQAHAPSVPIKSMKNSFLLFYLDSYFMG
jgi:hypothetical protein